MLQQQPPTGSRSRGVLHRKLRFDLSGLVGIGARARSDNSQRWRSTNIALASYVGRSTLTISERFRRGSEYHTYDASIGDEPRPTCLSLQPGSRTARAVFREPTAILGLARTARTDNCRITKHFNLECPRERSKIGWFVQGARMRQTADQMEARSPEGMMDIICAL